MKWVVYLDRQHSGKPGRKAEDRGAAADLDGDGLISVEEREAMLTARYGLAAEAALIEAGHIVVPIADGWYSDRHRRVNQYAGTFPKEYPQVYVSLHLNAGRGEYGAVFYDHRSRSGPELSARIAKQLRMVAPEVNGVKCIPAKPDDWTRAAYGTIGGIMQPVGICYEPCFMDNPAHADLLTREGLAAIGRALAAGIDAWATTCEV